MLELPGLWSLSPIGFGLGVIAVVYWLLVSGRLIPRSSHERELDVHKVRGDEWKETALEYRRANTVLRDQNSDLIQSNKVVEQLLRAAGPPGSTDTPGGV